VTSLCECGKRRTTTQGDPPRHTGQLGSAANIVFIRTISADWLVIIDCANFFTSAF